MVTRELDQRRVSRRLFPSLSSLQATVPYIYICILNYSEVNLCGRRWRERVRVMANQIMVIAPYWLDEAGTWVFDDPATDLKQEPFVEGIQN